MSFGLCGTTTPPEVNDCVEALEITGAMDLAAAMACTAFSYFDSEIVETQLWHEPYPPCVVLISGEGSRREGQWKFAAVMRVTQNWIAYISTAARDRFAFGYESQDAPKGVFFVCPCCAWPHLEEPPVVGRKAVCPCCALAFDTAPRERADTPYAGHFSAWIEAGAPFRESVKMPKRWSALEQLAAVEIELDDEDRALILLGGKKPVLEVIQGGTLPTWAGWLAQHRAQVKHPARSLKAA